MWTGSVPECLALLPSTAGAGTGRPPESPTVFWESGRQGFTVRPRLLPHHACTAVTGPPFVPAS